MSNQHLIGINIVDINDSDNFSIENLTDAELETLAGAGWLSDAASWVSKKATGVVGGAIGAAYGAVNGALGGDSDVWDGAGDGYDIGEKIGGVLF